MTPAHEVISAFVDGEPFDAAELAGALADPDGRELLIDLIALRHLVESDVPAPSIVDDVVLPPRHSRAPWLVAGLVAAVAVFAVPAAYRIGARSAPRTEAMVEKVEAPPPSVGLAVAPEPTSVIRLEPGVNWHESSAGGR